MSRGKDIQLSKALSWLLRHGAAKEGFSFEPGGYLYVEDLLKHKTFRQYSVADVERVVANNEKKRFCLRVDPSNGKFQIRANQGHSLQVDDLELEVVTNVEEIPVVIHGTYSKYMNKITQDGLSRMNRNHIHFACGEPGTDAVISGMRRSCQVYIYIDVARAMEDGFKFYRSTNNVILCPGNENGYLPPKYFKDIVIV